jgi:hypothetical protein
MKSGGPPPKSKTERENEKLNNQMLKAQLAQMGKEQEMPAYEAPPAPKYAPPPSSTSQDTEAAAQEAMRAAKRRRGFAKSRLAAPMAGASVVSTAPAGTKTTLGPAKSTLG